MITVIVPTYNEEDDIAECVLSLSKQSLEHELIVVDDGSVDSTLSQIPDIPKYKITVLKQKHKGPGAARNLAAQKAKGEILVFVDADMVFDKDFLKNLVRPIKKAGVVGTFSKEEYLYNKNNPWAVFWNINRGLPEDKMLPKDYPDRQKVFRAVTRSDFLKVGGFDTKAGYTDDWSLSSKLGEMAVNAKGAVFYHKNPSTLSEIFKQSRWIGKRKYKLGAVGYLAGLLRSSLPFSVFYGLLGSLKTMDLRYFVFKIVSDFGVFIGILEYAFSGRVAK